MAKAPKFLTGCMVGCIVFLSSVPVSIRFMYHEQHWAVSDLDRFEENLRVAFEETTQMLAGVSTVDTIDSNDINSNNGDTNQTRTATANANAKPELFLDRLNRLLPEDDSVTQLTLDQIQAIEEELLAFDIPRDVVVQFPKSAHYTSIAFYKWLFHDQDKPVDQKQCPRCHLLFHKWTKPENRHMSHYAYKFRQNHEAGLAGHGLNSTTDTLVPDVKMFPGCPRDRSPNDPQEFPWQVMIGGCGESQEQPRGRPYARQGGRQKFHYHAGFEKVHNGLFQTSFAHTHLVPNPGIVPGFPTQEVRTLTDFCRQILTEHPQVPLLSEEEHGHQTKNKNVHPSMFVHNNCGNKRGTVLDKLTRKEKGGQLVARYGKCFHNIAVPSTVRNYTECTKKHLNYLWPHKDCEAMRDSMKSTLAAYHPFTFSLENAFSQDYVTEKRWQALVAGSVPIVWDNHNSLDSLPDPSAALVLKSRAAVDFIVQHLEREFAEYQTHKDEGTDQAYLTNKYFGWKNRQTLPVSFVRKIFLSKNLLPCRICEHVAHHHSRSTPAKEDLTRYYETAGISSLLDMEYPDVQ